MDYYPACKVKLIVRIDEMGDTASADSGVPSAKKMITQAKGKADSKDNLQVVKDPDAPVGVTRYMLAPKSSKPAGKQQAATRSDDIRTFELPPIIPRKATWKVESPREAETFKADIRYSQLPFDPRVIRSCAVEFYLGTVSANEYSALMDTSSGRPMLPDTTEWVDGSTQSNLKFQGWVDEWSVQWGEDEEPIVSLECRDNTKLLIDQESAPQLALDEKLGIDEAIAKYLANYPQFVGLSVEYRPNGADVPKLSNVVSPTSFKAKIGITPSKGGDSKLSVWDFLTEVCGSIGHMVRMEGVVVVIQRVRTLTNTTYASRLNDPYQRRIIDGNYFFRRALVYGENLQTLKIARKYGRGSPKNVEVRCYNSARKSTIVVRYPEKTEAVTDPLNPGSGAGEKSVHVIRMTGILDDKTMKIVAQSAYETLSRGELSVHATTKSLASFGGGNADPDLLYLKPGDGVDLMVKHSGADLPKATSEESARALLRAAGFSGQLVDKYCSAYASQGFQNTFMTRGLQVDYDAAEEGVRLDIELVNYLEARADKGDLP